MLNIVSLIDYKKGDINKLLMLQDKPPMFDEGLDGHERRRVLSTRCCSEADIKCFASDLYKIVYEESKTISDGEIKLKGKLGKFRNDPFTIYVAVLRHHYHHSADALFKREITIQDVYKKYLGKVTVPKTPEEFQAIQLGMLKDLLAFLEKIYTAISKENEDKDANKITGEIQKDDNGLIHCENVLLSKIFTPFIGRKCEITNKTTNCDKKSKSTYPYYSHFVNALYVDIWAIIQEDGEEPLHWHSILLPSDLKIGQKLHITKIESNKDENSRYRFIATQYKVSKSKFKSKKSVSIPELTIELGKEYPVEVDTHGNTFVGNVLIGKKKDCHKGDIVKIKKVHIVKNSNTVPSEYPYTAKELVKVRVESGSAKIYTVEKDENGVFHVEDMMIPSTVKITVGDRVMVLKAAENNNEKYKSRYPLYVQKFLRLNPDNPKAEEKATAIVGRFSKFIETNKRGLQWFAGAVVAGVAVVLSQTNILKN